MSYQPIRHWRRLAAAGITVVLLAFVIETAHHTVHHLHDEPATGECRASNAAIHTPTTAPPPVEFAPQSFVVIQVLVSTRPMVPACPSQSADQERAPPLAYSA